MTDDFTTTKDFHNILKTVSFYNFLDYQEERNNKTKLFRNCG